MEVKIASLNTNKREIIFNYILLTSQIILALEDVAKGKRLAEQQCKILSKGKELLRRIIEGATLVERKEFKNGVTPTVEGLSIYGYALSALKNLDDLITEKGYTEFFEKMYNEMSKLIEKRRMDDIDISLLERFFFTLGSLLRGEIQKESYPKQKPC